MAKIISSNNQRELKQQIVRNRQQQTWSNEQSKPRDEPIEKGDLDPGE
jgi:hypothetical protein